MRIPYCKQLNNIIVSIISFVLIACGNSSSLSNPTTTDKLFSETAHSRPNKPTGYLNKNIYQYDDRTYLLGFRQEGLLVVLPFIDFILEQRETEGSDPQLDRNIFKTQRGPVFLYGGGVSEWSNNCKSYMARITSTNLNQFEFGVVYVASENGEIVTYVTDAHWAACPTLRNQNEKLELSFASINFRQKYKRLIHKLDPPSLTYETFSRED